MDRYKIMKPYCRWFTRLSMVLLVCLVIKIIIFNTNCNSNKHKFGNVRAKEIWVNWDLYNGDGDDGGGNGDYGDGDGDEMTLPLFPPDEGGRGFEYHLRTLTTVNCNESSSIVYVVDPSGQLGNFTTVQASINAVPDNNLQRIIIYVFAGLYMEKVRVPITKTCIKLQGEGFNVTTIAWNDTANSAHGTYQSASFAIEASNFIARNISFANVAPPPIPGAVGAQAVALRVSADVAAFYSCGIFGAQDTLYDDQGRHYFKDCYIEGSIDFIFGNARSLYESCELHSIAMPPPPHKNRVTGAIAAHGRLNSQDRTGFSFVNCTITGTGRILLGRAWGPYAFTAFSYTYMSDIIVPQGWNDWNDPTRDKTLFFGEYLCTGPGSNTSARANYTTILNDTQAMSLLDVNYIDGLDWINFNDPVFPSQTRKSLYMNKKDNRFNILNYNNSTTSMFQ